MKKLFSILATVLMLTALLHFSVATHYCGGRISASVISLSGRLADCGMDQENEIPSPDVRLTSHCCDNTIVYYGIDSKYFPTNSYEPKIYKQILYVVSTPVILFRNPAPQTKSNQSDIGPPGEFNPVSVDLSDICILRI